MQATKDMPVFAKLTKEQLSYMESMTIDGAVLTPEQIDEIADTFALIDKSERELRAIRNSVVHYLGGIIGFARMCDNRRNYERAQAAMGAITAVIDHAIYCAAA